MNIPIDILVFIFSASLGTVAYFLNRILLRITAFETKLHEVDKEVAINKHDISIIKKAA